MALESGVVSTLRKCQTKEAKWLAVLDAERVFYENVDVDIGGTHNGSEPELWFICKMSSCIGQNYLLNLYVCNRRASNLNIKLNNNHSVESQRENSMGFLKNIAQDDTTTYSLNCMQKDEYIYLQTYNFFQEELKGLEVLFLGVNISEEQDKLNIELIKDVKQKHHIDMREYLFSLSPDCTLECNGLKVALQKVVLAAKSDVFREKIKNSNNIQIEKSDEPTFQALINFLTTGTIPAVNKTELSKLALLADYYKINDLKSLLA